MVLPHHLSPRKRKSRPEKPEKCSFISSLLEIPAKCRRYSMSIAKVGKKPKQEDVDQTYRTSLNVVEIPSHKLFASNDNIDGFPFSIEDCSLDDTRQETPRPVTPPTNRRESALPTMSFDSPSTPTKSILKSYNRESSPYTSPADTRANTSRNVLLTSDGSPRPTSLRRRIVNARRRCYSLPSLFLPFISMGDSGLLAAAIGTTSKGDKKGESKADPVAFQPKPEPESDSNYDSPPGTPTPKKSVRFDHVDVYPRPHRQRSTGRKEKAPTNVKSETKKEIKRENEDEGADADEEILEIRNRRRPSLRC